MTTGRINQVAAFPEERAAAQEKRRKFSFLEKPATTILVLKPRAELECMKGLKRYVCVCVAAPIRRHAGN